MVLITLEGEVGIESYVNDLNRRISIPTLKNILLKGEVWQSGNKYLIYIYPLVFRFYYLGLLGMVATLVLNHFTWTWWQIPSFILTASYMFWSDSGMSLLLWIGMRRQGYKERLQFHDSEDAIMEILNGTKRYNKIDADLKDAQ